MKGALGAPTHLMQRAGDEYLAGAGLALEQNDRVRRRNARDEREHLLEDGRTANQPLTRRQTFT